MYSSPCSRSRKIRNHTLSCISYYSVSSDSMSSTTSPSQRNAFIASSLTQSYGMERHHHLIHIGTSFFRRYWCARYDNFWIGCITCLRIWRVSIISAEHGASVCSAESDIHKFANAIDRHSCIQTSLRRSGRF